MLMYYEKSPNRITYDPNNSLPAGKYVIAPGDIPIVSTPTPRNPLNEIKKIIYYRGIITIIDSIVIGKIRWYNVHTVHGKGYINEMALYGKQILSV